MNKPSTVVNFPQPEGVLHLRSDASRPTCDASRVTELEAVELRRVLAERDALIRQLVAELVRANQQTRTLQNAAATAGGPSPAAHDHDQIMALRGQNQYLEENIRLLESQLKAAREEIGAREGGLRALLAKIQDLSENNRQMEKHLQEVPELYRRKFTERMNPVATRISNIQGENQRLQLEVQGMAQKLLAVQEVIAKPLMLTSGTPETAQVPAGLLAEMFEHEPATAPR